MIVAIIVIACVVAIAVMTFFINRAVQNRRRDKRIEAETGVKPERRSFKEWLIAHKPSKRRLIQVYAALLYNANLKGFISGEIYTSETTKYLCVPGLNCYSCPGAIGACPLGAFQNALAESSVRAPYYVFGILALFGLTLARTVCGFLCPVGLVQELLYKIRTPKLKKSRVTRVLSYFKYVLLVGLAIIVPLMYAFRDVPLPGFCKYICPAGTLGGAIGLLINPNNADMFGMLGGQFAWKFSLLIAFIVASVFIFRFFCRFFCPLGAIYGFFNKIALIGVKVEKNDCTDCGKCVSVCKMDVMKVGDHECINCGECIAVCPTQAIRWKGSQIFLHKSAIDTTPELKPIDCLNASVSVNSAEIAVADEPEAEPAAVKPIKTRRKRGRKFWLQLSAWIAAIAVLVGALVYYNFIDVPKTETPPVVDDGGDSGTEKPGDGSEGQKPSVSVVTGNKVGDTAPDFTVQLYGSDESFTLYENRGKLTVINFWATWCTPCVAEIPYFNELAAEYPDISVIAIHGLITQDDVNKFIENKWPGHALTFAQDNMEGATCLTYKLLGGKSLWPMTLIVDGEGKVLYNSTKSFHSYDELKTLVNGFLTAE